MEVWGTHSLLEISKRSSVSHLSTCNMYLYLYILSYNILFYTILSPFPPYLSSGNEKIITIWVILLNLVHARNLQFLAISHNLAGNEHGLLAKTNKTPINTPK